MLNVKEKLKRKIDELSDDVAEFLLEELEEIIEDYYSIKVAKARQNDEAVAFDEAIKELKKSGHLAPDYPESSY